jgi:hypothetical protein
MDHLVYLDARANELENLMQCKKTMLIRGATGRKLPYGRVDVGDVLYFINNNAEGYVKAKSVVSSVFNSDKMSREDSICLVKEHQAELLLTEKQFQRWAGKRYIVLIGVEKVENIIPFTIDKKSCGNMDDWLPVEQIERIKK